MPMPRAMTRRWSIVACRRKRTPEPRLFGRRLQHRHPDRGGARQIGIERHRDIFAAPPKLCQIVVMAAEEVARLAGRDDEDAAVGIGEIIDPAKASAMHVV